MSGRKEPDDVRKEDEFEEGLESDLSDLLGIDVDVSLVQVNEHGREIDLEFEVRPEPEALATLLRDHDADQYGDVVVGERGRIVRRIGPESDAVSGDTASGADPTDGENDEDAE